METAKNDLVIRDVTLSPAQRRRIARLHDGRDSIVWRIERLTTLPTGDLLVTLDNHETVPIPSDQFVPPPEPLAGVLPKRLLAC